MLDLYSLNVRLITYALVDLKIQLGPKGVGGYQAHFLDPLSSDAAESTLQRHQGQYEHLGELGVVWE